MKYTALAAVLVALLPAVASADSKHSRHHDRGKGYSSHKSDKSRFDISVGFGSSGYRDYSYANFRYSSGYGKGYAPRYPAPRYSPPPVVYRPAPCPPPVVYFPPPPVVYYPSPIYYRPVYGAYGYGGGCYR